MELLAIEVAVGMAICLMGWLHLRQNKLEDQLQQCVHKNDLDEIKEDLKTTLELLTEVRVENAKWQGLMQRALENG